MEIDFPFECQSSYLKNTNKYSWNIPKKNWWSVLYLCFQDWGRMRTHKWSVKCKVKTANYVWFTLQSDHCTQCSYSFKASVTIHIKKTHVIKPFVLRIFTKRTDCQVCFIALKDLFVLNVIRHWFSHCVMCAVLPGSPFLAWRHGTRHLWCLSPNPDRPKAQIPACYSNMMQPVEDKDFSHWKASYYMLQWNETGHEHNRFALNVLTAPSPGACWGLTQSVHCEHKYVIWALHAVSPPPLCRTNSLAVCFAYHPSVRKVGQKK